MSNATALALRDDLGLAELGTILAKSGFFQDVKDASQAIVKVLAGRELGVGAIMSMAHVHVIKGKATVGAAIMAAAVKGSGRYNYRITEHTNEACTVVFHERNGDQWEAVYTSRFTTDDAKRAGILSNDNWQKYPRNMLFARALSNGARFACPEVIVGMYTPEELGAEVDEDGHVLRVLDVTPEPAPAAPPLPWTQDPQALGRFWAWTRDTRALEAAQVHAALDVDHLRDFAGSKQDAIDAIEAYITRAQSAQDED